MRPEECRQTLGVAADARPEAIRQAYLDLVRVWHPDRFESDPRLRKIAEQRFQEITQAYSGLKNYRSSPPPAAAPRPTPRPSPRPSSAAAVEDPPPAPRATSWTPPFPPRRSIRIFRRPRHDSVGQFALIGCLVAAPFVAAWNLVPLLSVPVFDTQLAASRAFRPRILTPMQTIDASSDVHAAADALTEWARGDAVDLWQPAGVETRSARPIAAPALRKFPERRAPDPPLPPPPPNGADLYNSGRDGAGELQLANHSDLEAVVKLVSRNRSLVRAVYVAPNSSAVVRSIGVGVYELDVDLGRGLDPEHLRFRADRFTPEPLGPFAFAEITSDSGVSGNRYDVVLNAR